MVNLAAPIDPAVVAVVFLTTLVAITTGGLGILQWSTPREIIAQVVTGVKAQALVLNPNRSRGLRVRLTGVDLLKDATVMQRHPPVFLWKFYGLYGWAGLNPVIDIYGTGEPAGRSIPNSGRSNF